MKTRKVVKLEDIQWCGIRDEIMNLSSPTTVIDIVGTCADPDQVFTVDELTAWAENNGWVKKP